MFMLKFAEIYQRAVVNKGGEEALTHQLGRYNDIERPQDVLMKLDESLFLAEMTRCVFQAGFVWRVIDNKWAGFEEVFHQFDVNEVLSMLPEDWDDVRQDARIVRNGQKISSVRINAQFIEDVMFEFGSFAEFIAQWPATDLIGLFAVLKQRGSRLGGNTGQRFLRNMGKDTFILTQDVVRCLQISGLDIKASPTSKRDLKAIQHTFNDWHEESGVSCAQMSKIAAFSITS